MNAFSTVKLNPAENRNIYLWGALFIFAGLAGIWFEFYEIVLLPALLGGILLAWQKPVQYVLLICLATPLSVFVEDVGGGLGLSVPTEPMIWVVFIPFVISVFISGKFDVKLLRMPLVALILINVFWMLVTVFTSSMPLISLKYLLARLWFAGIFFFFLLRAFEKQEIITGFFTYTITGTAIVVAITLFKHAGEGFTRGWGYAIMQPFYSDHTIYSAAISFFVPVAAMFAFRGHLFRFSLMKRMFFLFLVLLFAVGIIFSYTRASWISLIAAAAFYLLIKLKVTFRQMISVLLLGCAVVVLNLDQILYSLESNKQGSADDLESHAQSVSNITTDPSNLERLNRWDCAVRMFAERPVFGFGPGTYTFQYAPFQRPEKLTLISTHSGDLGNTHNEYLNALSEMGLIGFLSWLGVFLASVYTGLSIIYDTKKENWQKSMATASLLGLITYYIHAFLNNFSDFDKIAVPLWGFMAVLTALKYYSYRSEISLRVNTGEKQTCLSAGQSE